MSSCRLCKNENIELLIDFGMQPIVHNLKKDCKQEEGKFPFQIGHCKSCGFLQIIDCIPPEILYENYFTLSSWKNQPHTTRLIDVMHNICGENFNNSICEIGCNDGTFLLQLQNLGYKNIFGIEPTKDAYAQAIESGLNVKNDFFNKNFVVKNNLDNSFDIVITRQVLEHIEKLDDFINSIDFILKDDGKIVIEIPDSDWNLETLDYALWEEHINYFTLNTLNQLLSKHNFNIIHHERTLFSGRALIVYCERSNQQKKIEFKNLDIQKIEHYKDSWEIYIEQLHSFLKSQNKPVAIYGCGARSSTFVNFSKIAEYIDLFIDDQKEKQDLFLPGCNVPIKPWSEEYRDYVILLGVNTENEYKVIEKRDLDKKKTYSVLPPSSLLPEFWKNLKND